MQISMDGPNVNWKMYDNITEERRSEEYPGLIDVGCCSLHTVHGAFRTGVKNTNWNLEVLLRALHSYFSESPAKREDYIQVTGSDKFPFPFCGHRWIEDKQVAERALDIWPHITSFVVETLKKPNSKIPTSHSFMTMRSAVQDKLIVAKLQFIVSTASIMKSYLQMFQTDAPLLPFISSELQEMLQVLIGKFVKREVLEAADTGQKLPKLDVANIDNHLPPAQVNIGFAAASTLTKIQKEKKVSQLQIFEFRKECTTMLVSLVMKIQEKSPLKYSFVRNLVCLDPRLMISSPENATRMFQQTVNKLLELKWKTAEEGDLMLIQYKKFLSEGRKNHSAEFSSFKAGEDRLDSFFCDKLQGKEDFQHLWLTLQLLLTLSHGQAAVERGFSVNKEVLVPNLQENSLTAVRVIQSFIMAEIIKIADFVITEQLSKSCSQASARYRMYLLEKDKEKTTSEKGRKRKLLQDQLQTAKKRKEDLNSISRRLIDTADQKVKEAEKKKNAAEMRALIMESNATRGRSQKILTEEIPVLEKEITEVQRSIKKLEEK